MLVSLLVLLTIWVVDWLGGCLLIRCFFSFVCCMWFCGDFGWVVLFYVLVGLCGQFVSVWVGFVFV